MEEVKEVTKEVIVVEEIKEPEPPREPVKGMVTVKYNHYKEKFHIVDGVLMEADIDEQYCLSFVFKGDYHLHIREEKDPEKRY